MERAGPYKAGDQGEAGSIALSADARDASVLRLSACSSSVVFQRKATGSWPARAAGRGETQESGRGGASEEQGQSRGNALSAPRAAEGTERLIASPARW